ncbi:MAG: hypothetical protein J4F46_07325 [Dehalococcoidia bacterium]|nr:hypothetical protein [Dehalococcoidia bacterium]
MDELIARALDLARTQGAEYADIRVVNTDQERYAVKNGVMETLSIDQSQGFGVRVLVDGSWGFASSHDFSRTEVDRVTLLATEIARASALVPPVPSRGKGGVVLGTPVTSRGTYVTPIEIDPFTISSEQKLQLLMRADETMALV